MAKLNRDFVRLENDFTIIPNEILRNKEMKSSTKNILLTMIGLPPEWDFSIAGISACVYEGRETVQKALVELDGPVFKALQDNREKWAMNDCYIFPGAIQYFGPSSVCDITTITLQLEQEKTLVGV